MDIEKQKTVFASPISDSIDEAAELKLKGRIDEAIAAYRSIIKAPVLLDVVGEALDNDRRLRENAITLLGQLYVEHNRGEQLKSLFVDIRPIFETLPKARTAKIVRTLLDLAGNIKEDLQLQEQLCLESIVWTRQEKRTFLRHRIQLRLAILYYQQSNFTKCLEIIQSLLYEVKKLDDKLLLLEIHLQESKLYFAIKNLAKSKAALTASRTNANAIHCPPLLQAEIDLQSGILHCDEKDYQTAYSYFYEAFEALNVASDPRASKALAYMLLSKIMNERPDDVSSIATGKHALAYTGRQIEALIAVAKSHKKRSIKMFEDSLEAYHDELKKNDSVIARHIGELHETMLEQNILKLLEPYDKVEIAHVAKLLELPLSRIQAKLGEMILDKRIEGTLDQGDGFLILFSNTGVVNLHDDILPTFKNISNVVAALNQKAQRAF